MRRILALAPHPDDIEIGCGGTLAVHADRGDDVHLFIATEGDVGGNAKTRRAEQQQSAEILGVKEIHWGGYSDTCLPQQAMALMETLEKLVKQVEPDTVYVNHRDDTHQDHRVLAQVANSVTRYVPNVLAYETPSSISFDPTLFMDINETMALKREALEAHASQVDRTHVKLNIIEIALATAHFRGVQGKLSCAEGFVPVRMRL
ncbi:MAG: PIG-L deacetylase family protein [Mariprofundaceae bacterium]